MDMDRLIVKLKGKPGTKVNVTIRRFGVPDDFEVEIVRDIIKIASIPFVLILDGNIGYI